ncbi:hypothetical protein CRYUN_Cryun13aG0125500 [Craigia yunnanensis]
MKWKSHHRKSFNNLNLLLPADRKDISRNLPGEEFILDSVTTYEDREPIYEGEVILANPADKRAVEDSNVRSKDEITPQQDGLKERELCVFFRNNHFSTMFKYDGELYLLATDQGYLNQPDLVWKKLNEVNGDTLFMTGNSKEFKVDSHATGTWDEQNAIASTAVRISLCRENLNG